MYNSYEVKMLLGYPVVNVELSDEQIQLNIDISVADAKDLIQLYGCPDLLLDYVTEKLTIINCKKNLSMNLNKYEGKFHDGLAFTTHAYDSALHDEQMLFDLLNRDWS